MTEWSDYLVLDIFTELAFGKSFETKEPGDNPKKAVPHTVVQYLKFMYPVSQNKYDFLVVFLLTTAIRIDHVVSFPRSMDLAETKGAG